jgi:hypothetical protein
MGNHERRPRSRQMITRRSADAERRDDEIDQLDPDERRDDSADITPASGKEKG